MTVTVDSNDLLDLDLVATRHEALIAAEPRLRTREAAARLGVPEAAVVGLDLGYGTVRLDSDPLTILPRLASLGEVMGLTRNEHAVIEKTGLYEGWHGHRHAAMFVGPEIDLRCFVGSWKHCFAVGGARPSIQFFDGQGQAVHKVFARPATNTEAWDALIRDYTAGDQSRQLVVQAAAEIKPTADPETVNRDALIDAWGGLQDVHYFHGLLRTFNITRVHATRLVEGAYSRSVAPLTVVDCLEKAAANTIPMLIFVGNHANIQIHGGPIERTAWKDQWFNVLDPRFNLHLATDGIAESWITTKPVKGGTVTALECYDREGEVIVSLFGHRKEKQQEREDWRGLIQTLGRESDVDTAVQGAD